MTLTGGLAGDAGGRLLLFAEPAKPANVAADNVDKQDPGEDGVSVAAHDIAGFGAGRTVTIDTGRAAFPARFAALAPGDYRVQAVLDRNRDYAYGGRGPGDLVSKVVTLRFPLTGTPAIALDHAVQPLSGQFDTTGLPPAQRSRSPRRALTSMTSLSCHLR